MNSEDILLQHKVSNFADKLLEKLQRTGRKVAWHRSDRRWLLMRLRQEVEELEYALNHGAMDDEEVRDECYDVAAFSMMLWDRTNQMGMGEASK